MCDTPRRVSCFQICDCVAPIPGQTRWPLGYLGSLLSTLCGVHQGNGDIEGLSPSLSLEGVKFEFRVSGPRGLARVRHLCNPSLICFVFCAVRSNPCPGRRRRVTLHGSSPLIYQIRQASRGRKLLPRRAVFIQMSVRKRGLQQ